MPMAAMAENTPAEGQATANAPSSQIHPLLRQRMLNRAATFTEGAQLPQPLNRRRSSVLSENSDTRQSFRSSTDSLLRTTGHEMNTMTSSEPSVWHSAPLAFAILPAVGGLLFQNGSHVVTDGLLLLFASMFLNWCIRWPWDWYYAAQQVQYVDEDEERPTDTIAEADEESGMAVEDDGPTPVDPASVTSAKPNVPRPAMTTAQKAAYRELARDEMLALVACFLGPLLGAYLLHAIRGQLTRPAEGLVSNYNLTIFVMAAELRPVSHVIKLKQGRMMQLQRVLRPESSPRLAKGDAQDITRRLADIESRLAEPGTSSDVETLKITANVRQGLQPQLDALNRAVRRYEKRQAAQTIQIESRFGELEARLKDALSLAAAAARSGQRPGLISMLLTWVVSGVAYGVETSWALAMYPFGVVNSVTTGVKSWFVEAEQQPRKRIKGQLNNGLPPSMLSTPRMQSRTGR